MPAFNFIWRFEGDGVWRAGRCLSRRCCHQRSRSPARPLSLRIGLTAMLLALPIATAKPGHLAKGMQQHFFAIPRRRYRAGACAGEASLMRRLSPERPHVRLAGRHRAKISLTRFLNGLRLGFFGGGGAGGRRFAAIYARAISSDIPPWFTSQRYSAVHIDASAGFRDCREAAFGGARCQSAAHG